MEYITLKNSDLKVSRLCMGGCPMGGYGWGDTQENELIDAVRAAVDSGITLFDNADTYGLGQSERTLGKALGADRPNVCIATKFGVRVGGGKTVYDNSPEWIRTALDASLEGKIRYFGLSNIHADSFAEVEPFVGKFVSCQNEYSLACRKNEADMLALYEKLGMNPLTWGSLGQGILTGKYTKDNVNFGPDDRRSRDIYVNFHGEKLMQNLEIVEVMRGIAANHDKPVSAVAIRYILDYLPESIVLCGAKRPSQILGNVEGADWHLTEEEIKALDEVSK